MSAAHNVSTFTIPCDVRIESDVAASLDEIIEEWERIDYAVNSASASFFSSSFLSLLPDISQAMALGIQYVYGYKKLTHGVAGLIFFRCLFPRLVAQDLARGVRQGHERQLQGHHDLVARGDLAHAAAGRPRDARRPPREQGRHRKHL